MATIVNTGGGGAAVKFNVFCQPTAPAEKNGIWLKTSAKVSPKKIAFDTSVWAGNQWVIPSPVASLPRELAYSASTVLGKEIYYFGGTYSPGGSYLNTGMAYNTQTNTYRTLATFSSLNSVSGASCGEHNGRIYILGGYPGQMGGMIYDPETNTYMEPKKTYKANAGTINTNEFMYLIGGDNSVSGSRRYYDTVTAFSYETETYTDLSTMPQPRSYPACSKYGDDIFIFSGRNQSANITSCLKYNITTKTFQSTILPPTTGYIGMGAVTIDDKIYLFGGYNADGKSTTTCFVYDPILNRASDFPSMEEARSNMILEKVNDRVYLMGGKKGSSTHINACECLSLTPKQYPDNPTAIIYRQPNDYTHLTSLLATKLIDYLPIYFKDAMLFKDGDVTFPAVYCGDGTTWNIIREEQ